MNKYRAKAGDTEVFGNLLTLADGVFIINTDCYGDIDAPEYHSSGMGCGIEDRGITDRYEACEHGWNAAVDRYTENLPEFIAVDPESVELLILEDSKGVRHFENDTYLDTFGSTIRIYYDPELLAVMGVEFDEYGDYGTSTIIRSDLENKFTKL